MTIYSATFNEGFLGEQLLKSGDLPNDAELLILYGGEDIATEFYNQMPMYSHGPHRKSNRDKLEERLVNQAIERKVPILGICRGAQLLNCLFGGTLWQDVPKHASGERGHFVDVSYKGEHFSFKTNSYHHQMLRVNPNNSIIIGVANEYISPTTRYSEIPIVNDDPEVEMVLWPTFKALGVQFHPEWMSSHSDAVKFVQTLLKEELNVIHTRL